MMQTNEIRLRSLFACKAFIMAINNDQETKIRIRQAPMGVE
jgi:hypothetical protein